MTETEKGELTFDKIAMYTGVLVDVVFCTKVIFVFQQFLTGVIFGIFNGSTLVSI